MVYCSLCKETKDSKVNWIISDNGVDGLVKKYRICDDCAMYLIKQVSRDILGLRENEELSFPLELTKIGALDKVQISNDSDLEIVLKIDFSQARRLIEKKTEKEALTSMKKP